MPRDIIGGEVKPKKRKANSWNSGTLELCDRCWMAESTVGVVSAILTVYDKLPAGGKPRDDEYTVLAAIVAVSDTGEQVVVSLATGTKCIGRDFDNKTGCLLSDSHAEVVARRGFIRYLHEQLRKMVDSPSHHPPFLEVHSSPADVEHPTIALKAGWKLVLYASDSPCGDAALYEANLSGEAKVVTGAKACAAEGAEAVGCVRTKSGRSDIAAEARTSSMSCSDKISRWSYLGLQGSLLAAWISPLPLSGVVVDRDPLAVGDGQLRVLQRAMSHRMAQSTTGTQESAISTCSRQAPRSDEKSDVSSSRDGATGAGAAGRRGLSAMTANCCVLNAGELCFPSGKAIMKFRVPSLRDGGDGAVAEEGPLGKRRRKNPLSPCGFSINWQSGTDYLPTIQQFVTVPSETDKSAALSSQPFHNTGSADRPLVKRTKALPVVAGGTVEITIAHTGALQGSVKTAVGEPGAASRLSRHAMRGLFETLVAECVEKLQSSPLASSMLRSLYQCAQLGKQVEPRPGEENSQLSLSAVSLPLVTEASAPSADSKEEEFSPCVSGDCARAREEPGGQSVASEASALLCTVRSATLGELKRICGAQGYIDTKKEFLQHPIFSQWLCDD